MFDHAAHLGGVLFGAWVAIMPTLCAVLCCAVPCRAVPCRAVPCRAVPCHFVLSIFIYFCFCLSFSWYLKYGHQHTWDKRAWLVKKWHKLREKAWDNWLFKNGIISGTLCMLRRSRSTLSRGLSVICDLRPRDARRERKNRRTDEMRGKTGSRGARAEMCMWKEIQESPTKSARRT